jgi:hypothetical protein
LGGIEIWGLLSAKNIRAFAFGKKVSLNLAKERG